MITTENLAFTYEGDSAPVWQHIDASFQSETFNLILGPSGCGKSTFLYALNGTVPGCYDGKLEGRVLLDGEEIAGTGPAGLSDRIGLVFQDPECQFCTFTVEDELAFGLENRRVPPGEIGGRIDRALELVRMGEFRKAQISELSGGQKQKIAIACVLAMDPAVLLLDEPTANLDGSSRRDIFSLLNRLCREHGKTILLVEHNLDGILEYVDDLTVFDRAGCLRLQGPRREVIDRLLFEDSLADVPVFLSQELLVIRQWARACRSRGTREALRACFLGGTRDLAPLDAVLRPPSGDGPREERPRERGEEVLSLRGVNFSSGAEKRRGRRREEGTEPLLRAVDFQIFQGDFVALLGENGAGKTTLLNVIFRALAAQSGEIRLLGRPMDTYSRKESYREMGLVFQNPEWQFVANRVDEELQFSLRKSPLPEAEKDARVEAMLAQFHLSELREKNPFSLSQGQKRRLSVSTMLLTGQRILFLDEPTYGQDFRQSRELMDRIRALNAGGVTIVMVSHDMSLVAQYARRVLVLHGGSVALDGTPDTLFADPSLMESACLEMPPLFAWSRLLHERYAWIPVTGRMDVLLQSLIQSTKGGTEDVCV